MALTLGKLTVNSWCTRRTVYYANRKIIQRLIIIVVITFWSPNRICLRAFLETFIRHKNIRLHPWSSAEVWLLDSSVCTAWWSCLSIMSYTLSPCMRRSSCKDKEQKNKKTEWIKKIPSQYWFRCRYTYIRLRCGEQVISNTSNAYERLRIL